MSQGQEPMHRLVDLVIRILSEATSERGVALRAQKPDLMHRRIVRRMAAGQWADSADYLAVLRFDRAEREALVRELLVGVSGFFRDPRAFGVLEERVLPELVRRAGPGGRIRVWVPACATGEEAYSVAMLLDEELHRQRSSARFAVLATDIQRWAVARARQGLYRASVLATIGPERLRRHFDADASGYRVRAGLRARVEFGVRDVIQDPPFAGIDLVTCRNLLIHLRRGYQRRVVCSLHSALVRGGWLMLGPSEALPADLVSGFDDIDPRWRVFQRRGATWKRRPWTGVA